ncbi:MAG: heavy metal translocating P-type ATPase [Acidobacteria bacterium]|nr:heavy metal translocating P-type ATPase [Acidobacteriota bacterium]
MTVDPKTARSAKGPDGRTYYFCAPRCLERFVSGALPRPAAPAVMTIGKIGSTPKPAAVGSVEARPFTCPMHPEIVKQGPGACPICGMALEPVEVAAGPEGNPELDAMTRRLKIAAALALPLLVLEMAPMIPGVPAHDGLGATSGAWLQLLLATPVVLWCGLPFWERGWASVVNRSPNMFTLIAMGIGVAYGSSLAATIAPWIFPPAFREADGSVPLYFEAAAVITALVLVGQVLELGARDRTGSAIRALLGLRPRTSRRLDAAGGEEEIPTEHVMPGDHLRIRPGEKFPVDGAVLEGTGTVDESMLTGEPVPVAKVAGARLAAGTINGTGSFVMRAERVGRDTLLAQIVKLVTESQRSRAPIQRLADSVAAWFVPAVVVAAGITFGVWATFGPDPRLAHALAAAVAVLIIACPCALGLATPMSILVGAGRGAMAGVLVRNAEALERLEKVDTLLVDKTGTLTDGKPKVVAIKAAASETEVLSLAAAVGAASEHPLSGAILAAARERSLAIPPATEFESITGKGIRGRVEGRRVAVGSRALLDDAPATDAAGLLEGAEEFRSHGWTAVFVVVDGSVAGLLAISDPVKTSTRPALRALKAEGLRVVMVTGDGVTTALAIGKELGIDDVMAGVLPAEKADVVARLQREGHVVAMAGDGINDAPALARADVGIAMGTGTDVAIESASITLLHGDLAGIARARRLSRATMGNIRQNLWLAFGYNVLAVPIAAGALYPVFGLLLSPMIASAAMSFSSVSVIANALRLRRVVL